LLTYFEGVARRTRYRKGEGERLRIELLEAASQLLAAAGDPRYVSVRAVAEAVGVTSPSVYRHFPSKQDLVREVLALRFGEFRETLVAAARGTSDAGERLLWACRAYVRFGLANPGHYRLLFSTAGMGPAGAGLRQGAPHPGAASLATLIELVADRVGDGVRSSPLALELWASLHGIVDLRITKPELDWPPEDDLIQLAVRAIDEAATNRA
jgi:AcrR family transcriptional regulator